jgi:transposase
LRKALNFSILSDLSLVLKTDILKFSKGARKMIQALLPIFPKETTRINDILAFQKKEGHVYYFNATMPIFSHHEDDLASFRMITSQLYINGNCKQIDIVKAFGVSANSVKRYVKKYRKEGLEGFFSKKPVKRTPRVLTPEVIDRAQQMLNNGKARSEISKQLNIKPDTLYRCIHSARLVEPVKNSARVITKSQRSALDSQADMGTACTQVMERVAASVGILDEVPTRFDTCYDVPNGGVLCALPALLTSGLLRHTSEYFSLPKGYYSLVQIFLLLAFMALARVMNTEQLRFHSPGEWGNLLGLDRIPEVKTLRQKIKHIAEAGKVSEWGGVLSKEWMQSEPEAAGILYIDGHVRVYNGSKTKLPRRYVARQKLCLRGMTDYWVNDQQGRPFFVISTAFTSGLLDMLRAEIVPRLLREVPGQPSGAELKADRYLHRFVIIFDREGYSPQYFKEMRQQRIACQTYHKYPKDDWPEIEFVEHTVEMSFGQQVKMKLAERGVFLGKKLWVREIRKLTDSGHQVPVLSTDYKSEMTTIASHMFCRWSQENFFKYMRKHYNIQGLIDYNTEAVDETKKVVNPTYRKLESQSRSKSAKLSRKKAEFYNISLKEEELDPEQIAEYERQKGEIKEEIDLLEKDIEIIREKRKKHSKHIPMSELPEEDRFEQLSPIRKQFMDTIKMTAYRAETAMAIVMRSILARLDDARALLRDLYTSDADLMPDYEAKTLTVRLHHFTNPLSDKAVRTLCETLNESETIYPGTDMRMIYKLGSE